MRILVWQHHTTLKGPFRQERKRRHAGLDYATLTQVLSEGEFSPTGFIFLALNSVDIIGVTPDLYQGGECQN